MRPQEKVSGRSAPGCPATNGLIWSVQSVHRIGAGGVAFGAAAEAAAAAEDCSDVVMVEANEVQPESTTTAHRRLPRRAAIEPRRDCMIDERRRRAWQPSQPVSRRR